MLERIKKAILCLGVLLFIFFLTSPIHEISTPANRSLGLFFLTFSLWLTRYLPLSVTGLLVFALIPLLGILPLSESYSLFGNRAIFFILGSFILAGGLMKTGLSRRIAFHIISKFARSGRNLILGVFWTGAVLSFFMPEHAAAAILFPIVIEIAGILKLKPKESLFSRFLFLSLAWGCVIGGIGTLLGGARAPLAIGMLEENFGIRISFLRWSMYAMPVSIGGLLAGTLILTLALRDTPEVSSFKEKAKEELKGMGRLKRDERVVLFVYILTLTGWIFFNRWIDISLIAILSSSLLFLFRGITWKDVERWVNWGIILMYAGAMALGVSLVRSGAAAYISQRYFFSLAKTPFTTLAVFSLLSLVLTEGMSNVATVALLLPVVYGLPFDPVLLTLCITIPGGLALCLPMGTPPNAIAFSSGYYELRFSIKFGVMLTFILYLILLLVGRFYWPLLGVEVW